MLYPKNNSRELDAALFRSPTSEYRGTPFWSWNCKLEQQELLRQIEVLKEMGMGGFHIHSRTGMATEYLSDEFMELVDACRRKAEAEDMLCWLYDEDRWPSGAAGGYVTKNLRYRARHLTFSPSPLEGMEDGRELFETKISEYENGSASKPAGYLLCRYAVRLSGGYLEDYKRLTYDEAPAAYDKWYVYIELEKESPWYNNETYSDTLNNDAIAEFIRTTYDRYYEKLGDSFGTSVPAIFTDEPQFSRKRSLKFAGDKTVVTLPFTDDFPQTYMAAYGEDILSFLPELIWELAEGRVSVHRYRYHDHICERFTGAFADNIGKWCGEHNIMLTGHMIEEPTLLSQTAALGEAMRSYRSFQLPGIDMLCDRHEFTTAKQAQSAARQFGRPGVLSELYGVTNWDFDFKGHKLQGDWQAALGVTVRVHHLSWVSMEGEAKRDYPASINYQSPWYKEYPYIEDHFARINTALTRGRAKTSIGVIHPVESYWLYWGPFEQTFDKRADMETKFNSFIEWMLFGLIDFDYISESLFSGLCPEAAYPLAVGEASYDTIIVPGCVTLRSTTLERLEAFKDAGGNVIFMGEPPAYMDALPDDRGKRLAGRCANIPFTKKALMDKLDSSRIIDIRHEDGTRTDNLLYQLREDNGCCWLFVCHTYGKKNRLDEGEDIRLYIKGNLNAELYDTMTGSIQNISGSFDGEHTEMRFRIYAHDSILLKLTPSEQMICAEPAAYHKGSYTVSFTAAQPKETVLSEPNVLLLDMAEYSLDGSDWQGPEEIFRLDRTVRQSLRWPAKSSHVPQPWVVKHDQNASGHSLKLKYTIISDVTVTGCKIAMEKPDEHVILFNGQQIQPETNGYFTDKSIKTFLVPEIKKGANELILSRKFTRSTNIECLYLLGYFNVYAAGRTAVIKKKTNDISFGNIVNQGLPFYPGDITYYFDIEANGDNGYVLEIPRFCGPVTAVYVDGEKKGCIAFAPHRLSLGVLTKGTHTVGIRLYGSRINVFGQLHNANSECVWWGPDSWRPSGTDFSYEYILRPVGVMQSPVIYIENNEK